MLNPMDMSGRTVLVTGASSGIGRETAVLLSQLGARVILVGRNPERLAEALGRLEGTGHRSESLDLGELERIPDAVKRLASETGPLHGLVHAAGIHMLRPLRVASPANTDEVLRVNVSAAVQLVKGFRQKGVCAAPASVVLLSSVVGLVGQAGVSLYAASKGAVIALTKSLAVELAREGIRVNCVAPSLVHTEMSDKLLQSLGAEQRAAAEAMHLLGLGQPRDVAHAIAFLLAPTGSWITGSVLTVDGGYTAH